MAFTTRLFSLMYLEEVRVQVVYVYNAIQRKSECGPIYYSLSLLIPALMPSLDCPFSCVPACVCLCVCTWAPVQASGGIYKLCVHLGWSAISGHAIV